MSVSMILQGVPGYAKGDSSQNCCRTLSELYVCTHPHTHIYDTICECHFASGRGEELDQLLDHSLAVAMQQAPLYVGEACGVMIELLH